MERLRFHCRSTGWRASAAGDEHRACRALRGCASSVRADPEEADPSAEVRVEPTDATSLEGLTPVSRRQLPDLLGDAVLRPPRQQTLRRLPPRTAPEAKAHEVPLFWSGHGALGPVHLEPQPPLDESDHARHHPVPGALASDVDVAVVRVAHEAVAAPVELAVELVQHDVAQQRRQRTALRRSLVRAHHHSVGHHHLGLQHLADEPKQTPVLDPLAQPRQQAVRGGPGRRISPGPGPPPTRTLLPDASLPPRSPCDSSVPAGSHGSPRGRSARSAG